jgi:hypothetical protein
VIPFRPRNESILALSLGNWAKAQLIRHKIIRTLFERTLQLIITEP